MTRKNINIRELRSRETEISDKKAREERKKEENYKKAQRGKQDKQRNVKIGRVEEN